MLPRKCFLFFKSFSGRRYLQSKIAQDTRVFRNYQSLAPLLQDKGDVYLKTTAPVLLFPRARRETSGEGDIERDPESATLCVRPVARRQVAGALKALKSAVLCNPTDVNARNDLGLAIFKLGRDFYNRALQELKICTFKAASGLVSLSLAQRERERSRALAFPVFLREADCDTGVTIDPEHALSHKNLAAVYASHGALEEALHHAHEAVRLAPLDAPNTASSAFCADVSSKRHTMLSASSCAGNGAPKPGANLRRDGQLATGHTLRRPEGHAPTD